MRRNCSATPAQLGAGLAVVGLSSLLVASLFWWQGAVLVLPFALLEVLVLGTAFVVHARHATDFERIWLDGQRLVVEQESAGRMRRAEFVREWVRLRAAEGEGWLVEVTAGAQIVRVGRFLRPDQRAVLLNEMRQALRMA